MENFRLPPIGSPMWDSDGYPGYVEIAWTEWKTRRRSDVGQLYYLRIYRNYADPRFCPVIALITHMRMQGKATGPLFQNDEGKCLTVDKYRAIVTNIYDSVPGLHDCVAHSSRSSGAQWIARCGGGMSDVMDHMRCRCVETAKRYQDVGQQEGEAAIADSTSRDTDPVFAVWSWKRCMVNVRDTTTNQSSAAGRAATVNAARAARSDERTRTQTAANTRTRTSGPM